MRKLKPSTENEMVYQFLKMEIESDHYSEQIEAVLNEMQIDKSIVTDGNINSNRENELRAEVLRRFRGYRTAEIFENFPSKIDWVWTLFDKNDLPKIFYIVYDYWNELSNYTGSPLEAAKTIKSGKLIYGVLNDGALSGARLIRKGHKFPPLIFLTDYSESRYVILEGHGRMTAYGLVPDMFDDVPVLLGYCDECELNKWYGEMPEGELS
jgi:hypothetical protein